MSNNIREEHSEEIGWLKQACQLRVNRLYSQAIEVLKKVDAQPGDNIIAKTLLVHCLVETNEIEEMEGLLSKWLESDPGNDVANHFRASVDGSPIPESAPTKFVEAKFAAQAEGYDDLMKTWNYAWPACLQPLLKETNQVEKFNRVLDAGCGTGLLANSLRIFAGELVGVDLCRDMLRCIPNKNAYDELACSGLLEFLDSHDDSFDLIVAADTFSYFGNLALAIQKSFSALKTDGWLVFSLQEGPLDRDSYYLRMDGSFVHSPAYLIEQLGEAGVAGGTIRRVLLRQEFHERVYGLLVAVQRPTP